MVIIFNKYGLTLQISVSMRKEMIKNKIKYMSQIILEIFARHKNISYI